MKKVHSFILSLLLAFALTVNNTACSDATNLEKSTQLETITLTSRATGSIDKNTLELTIAFSNYANAPTKVDVYLQGRVNPVSSDTPVSNGKITIDVSELTDGSYGFYVKCGNVTSNTVSVTISRTGGTITISTENSSVTEKTASAVLHFKQNIDGTVYEFAEKETKSVAAGTSLSSLKKSYTGFTAQGLFLAEQPDGTYVVNIYYTRNIIAITLDANGGTIGGNSSAVHKGLYGSTIPLVKNLSLVNGEKSFGGWNTKDDGSGTSYEDGEFALTESTTLYAQWLDFYEVTVAEAAAKIESLGSGSYTIKVSGAITAADIENIKNAMLTDQNRLIALDLSQTSGLTELGKEAFTNKTGSLSYTGVPLTELKLPDSVATIGEYCFYNCDKLTKFYAPGVTTLKTGALYTCDILSEVILADEMEKIENLAFGYCYKITELTLNAKTIGSNIVAGDRSLVTINLGPIVEKIAVGAFEEVKVLKTITVSPDNTNFKLLDDLLYSADGTRLLRCPPALEKTEITLANTVTSIDEYAFGYCKNLKTAVLPNIEIISSHAFVFATSLTNVSIPKATKIDGMAFYRCESLSSITIPDTVTSIGMFAFAYDKALTSIFIPASVKSMSSEVFEYWTEDQTINCEAISKPSGWDNDWSIYSYNTPAKATINWGATR